MTDTRRAVVAVVALAAAVSVSAQAPTDFAGTWRLDPALTRVTGQPLRVGSVADGQKIREPLKTRHVSPIYPPGAQRDRLEGMVIIQAVIDRTGRVVDTRVMRSVPGLDDAAIAAVSQWEYQPATLNGAPVEVMMTVTVSFTLGLSAPRGQGAGFPGAPPPTTPMGRGGGQGANAQRGGGAPGVVRITQSRDALTVEQQTGAPVRIEIYGLDGAPRRNRVGGRGGAGAPEYVYVSRWDGGRVITDVTWPGLAEPIRTETRWIENGQMIVENSRPVPGGDPWVTRHVYVRERR
jgi:TonB family protein